MVICMQRGADLHMFQLMPMPLTVSCFSKIQIGFAFLVPAHLGSPGKRAIKRVCVCACVRACARACMRARRARACVYLPRFQPLISLLTGVNWSLFSLLNVTYLKEDL